MTITPENKMTLSHLLVQHKKKMQGQTYSGIVELLKGKGFDYNDSVGNKPDLQKMIRMAKIKASRERPSSSVGCDRNNRQRRIAKALASVIGHLEKNGYSSHPDDLPFLCSLAAGESIPENTDPAQAGGNLFASEDASEDAGEGE